MPNYHKMTVFEKQKRVLGYPPAFERLLTRDFFEKHIEGNPLFTDNYLVVLVHLLEILDTKGRCPSVVSGSKKEPELGYDRITYDTLAKLNLIYHSTNVAEEFLKISQSEVMCKVGFIAALGHDIGKIPAYYGKAYSSGDHASISARVLWSIDKFDTLSNAHKIIDAVRDHHSTPTSLFSKYLQQADQAARRIELGDDMPSFESLDSSGNIKSPDNLQVFHEPSPPVKVDLLGLKPSAFVECSNIKLSWLDSAALLDQIDTLINGLANGKWQAISLENHVYIRPEALISLAEKLSRNSKEFQIAKTSNQSRMDLMFSMVEHLRRDFNAVDITMVGPKFFGAKFIVKTGGQEKEMFLIPLYLHVFNRLPSELHQRKSALHLAVQSIKLKSNVGGAK